MSEAWTERIEQLLYDGETIETEVAVGENEIVVTSHRVLAFSPATDGENFRTVDLPNVLAVEKESEGRFGLLRRGVWGIVVGLGLYVAGLRLDFGSLLELPSAGSDGPGGNTGLESTLSTMQRIFDLFSLVDDLMVLVGTVGFFVGLLLVSAYVLTRGSYLSIVTAGDGEDVRIPIDGTTVGESTVSELETAIFPEGEPPEDGSILSEVVR